MKAACRLSGLHGSIPAAALAFMCLVTIYQVDLFSWSFQPVVAAVQIRTHAAAAMACIPSASHCAGLLATCLAAAADALSGTQGGSQHSQTPPVPGEGARQGDTGRLDLKYLPLLQAQLHATLLHLLSLAAEVRRALQ